MFDSMVYKLGVQFQIFRKTLKPVTKNQKTRDSNPDVQFEESQYTYAIQRLYGSVAINLNWTTSYVALNLWR